MRSERRTRKNRAVQPRTESKNLRAVFLEILSCRVIARIGMPCRCNTLISAWFSWVNMAAAKSRRLTPPGGSFLFRRYKCRATIETLAEIKNPRAVAFVTQANIAHGPQQVNNGVPANGVEPAGSGSTARRGFSRFAPT